jgi:hypothetical protein
VEQIAQFFPSPLVAKCEFGYILRDFNNVTHALPAPQ